MGNYLENPKEMIKEVIKEENAAQSKNLEVPKIYSKYLRATDEVHGEDCWNWLQRLKLKKESLGLLRQHKNKPYKQLLNAQHRHRMNFCFVQTIWQDKPNETISHVVSGRGKLWKNQYNIRRHDICLESNGLLSFPEMRAWI